MTGVNSLSAFTPTLTSLTNGASGNLQISVTVSCGFASGGILLFTVPSEITLPSTITCTGVSLISSVTCTHSTNAV